MNRKIFLFVMLWFMVACSTPNIVPTQPPPILPSPLPQVVASPLAEPSSTFAPPTVSAPALRDTITLYDLPGVGRDPYSLVTLDGKVYVINGTTNNVAVIQNNRAIKFIPVGNRPSDIVVDPATKRIYVSNSEDRTISLIVNDAVTLTTSVGEDPDNLLFFENRLFVGLGSIGNILVLDPTTLKTQSTIGMPKAFSIVHMAGDPIHHRLYAAIYDNIAVIDSTNLRIVTTFGPKGSYYALAANPVNDSILAAIFESDSGLQYLTAFDPLSGAVRARVKIGGDPRGIALTADSSRAYVANYFSNTVSVVNPRDLTQVAEIPVDSRPFGVALDEAAHRLYVSNSGSDSVNAIDTQTNQVVATIPLGMNFSALVTNESLNRVYIANTSTDSVYVVQGNQLVKEINVGRNPIDLARDEKNNRLVVANTADNTLSIIDESTFAVRTTQPITRYLTTVAVDNAHTRIFAGDQVLDANTLAPIGQVKLQGYTLGFSITPNLIRWNPNNNHIYVFASNGVPGSNGRQITYSIDSATLQQRGTLSFGGNTYFITIDPETNRVFIAGTNPMSFRSELGAYDANDTRVLTTTLNVRPAGITYNPMTHHLFISQAEIVEQNPPPDNNTILILDANSWGQVAKLNMTVPGLMARLGNIIYVANRDTGTIQLIQDANVPTPPSPTPTQTPTPYPTIPPLPSPTRTTTPIVRNTPLPLCAFPIASLAAQRWNTDLAARIGCPTEAEHAVGFATQTFERGAMFWREDEKHVYVLFSDKTWSQFDDAWNTTLPDDSCPSVAVTSGLTKPKRGFGKVWCEQSGARGKIGAATSAEVGFAPLTQKFEHGQIFAGTQTNQIFVLFTNGSWQ